MKKYFILSMLTYFLQGCSVYKAAQNEGISLEDVKKCDTKACFLAVGLDVIDKNDLQGEYVENYRGIIKKSAATYARSFGYAIADVMTFGIWEIIGTPLEESISNNREYVKVKVVYKDSSCEQIESIFFNR